jgi:hypothetical protein
MFMKTSIVIPEVLQTEVYINDFGNIAIMQPGEDHDDLIILSCKHQARMVSKAINQLLKIAKFEEDEA